MIIYFDGKKFDKLFKNVLQSEHSGFYRDKYAHLGQAVSGNPRKVFASLPPLTRKDISSTPPDQRCFISKEDVAFVAYTSGTTSGEPLILYWSEVKNYHFEPSLGTSARTLLITHPALNKNFGHTFIQQCRQAKQPVTPVFADYQNLAQSAVLARETGADALYATPTIALMLADHLEKYYDPYRIQLLAVFSENLTQLKRHELEKRYPNATIANLYGSTEIGQLLFYPCKTIMKEKSDGLHFISPAVVAIEIEQGELILTQWQNKAFPLIRYRTGDFFEVAKSLCPCGMETPLLSFSGRMDVDKLKINGIEIRAEDIESALRFCVAEIGNDYQLHFFSEKSTSHEKKAIRIVVEIVLPQSRRPGAFREERLAFLVKRDLLSHWHISQNATLQDAIDREILSVPEVHFVDELSAKTQKTRRIINHIP